MRWQLDLVVHFVTRGHAIATLTILLPSADVAALMMSVILGIVTTVLTGHSSVLKHEKKNGLNLASKKEEEVEREGTMTDLY